MKVLYVWEIGEDLGHISQFLPLALELRRRGHEVITALRELPRAEDIFGRHGITMLQAPIWQGNLLNPPQLPVSYAEMLFFYGYLDATRLTAMFRAWINLIDLLKPDLIIADHAPTALIAAKTLGIRRSTIGTGFFLPPPTTPLPNMRPWLPISSDRLTQSEGRVLATINVALETLAAEPLVRLADIFADAEHFLVTLRELDHYGRLEPVRYFGPILGAGGGAAPNWPEGQGPKAFAYLKPHYTQMGDVLEALSALKYRTVAFVSGASTKALKQFPNGAISISSRPYDIRQVASECDFGICHAGHGTICELLLKGKPMLLLPMNLEQSLSAKRVSDIGAGIVIEQNDPQKDFATAIQRIVGDHDITCRSLEFAQRYLEVSSTSVTNKVADECERIAGLHVASL